MTATSDRDHPGINKKKENGQNEAYLVLSDAEKAKGFVRPLRNTYQHVGLYPGHPLRDLTAEEKDRYPQYVKYEEYPEGEAACGKFWAQKQLDAKPCDATTTMATSIAETYACDPKFYGATFCTSCRTHLPVGEFVWLDGSRVGS